MHAPGVSARRRKQLRTAIAGVRQTPERTRPEPRHSGGDASIAARTADPYETVADAERELRELRDAFEARGDRRAIFLSIYARMTTAVADRIDRGGFEDPEWVGEYLVAFANHYRVAVHDYETGHRDRVPEAWQLAFDAAADPDVLVVQHAALGVNAHINYDLALAIDRVGVTPDRQRRYRDHERVTDVVRAIVDDAQEALAARDADGLATVDDALGDLDERLYVFTIDECRDSAWRTATALESRLRVRRRFARWVNAVTASGVATLILASTAVDTVQNTLVELERSGGDSA
jgi:hypothetical protein